jgi:hypothetical protein
MATPTFQDRSKQSTQKVTMSKWRIALWGLGLVLLAAIAWFALNFADLRAQAKLATAYGAHIACSCKYIAGRTLGTCARDFEPGMEMVSITDDPALKRITASIPILASATAERRGATGCVVLDDAELAAQ